MNFGVLFRTEWIKARHRLAARIPVLAFSGLLLLSFGGSYYMAMKKEETLPALPEAWPNILGGVGPLGAFFVAVVLMLLISSEFTWRTARQNVIDGLSREEWFGAKLILLPLAALTFLVIQLTIGGAFALAGTDFATVASPLMSAVDLASIGGYLLSLLGMGSLAIMLAFLTRNSGAAISVFFVYAAIGESLAGLLLRQTDLLADAARYLPVATFSRLQNRVTFDPAVLERMTEVAISAGRDVPTPPNTPLLLLLATLYTLLFLGIAFMGYRRRDL
jgi:ABC-type transport system involved in multi-copper enzyme maturation permease subunit